MAEETSICVPRRLSDWTPCSSDVSRQPIDYDPASLLDLYFEQLCLDYQCTRDKLSGPFFRSTHGKNGKRFINGNIGKNTLGQVGVEVAEELLLPFPETFSGHCWRRSAGTNASNNGVNVTTLMSVMGWACPKTAMEYVKHSRVTSLTMSMYLANVQRHNVSLPFPSTVSERKRKTIFPVLKNVHKKTCAPSNELSLNPDSNQLKNESLVEAFVGGVEKDNSYSASQDLFENSFDGNDRDVSGSNSFGGVVVAACNDSGKLKETEKIVQNQSNVSSESFVSSDSLQFSAIDSRLGSFLSNFQNHGTVNISFNFNEKK